jgi:hypothetical protein
MPRALALLLTCVYVLSAQDHVAQEMMYHRVWAIVPLVGTGTADDPRRPMFAPSLADSKARAKALQDAAISKKDVPPPAIISFTMQLADDKKSAIVEFVGLNPQALEFITASKDPRVKVFERGKATKQEIETEMKKVKAGFTLDSFTNQASVASAVKGVTK